MLKFIACSLLVSMTTVVHYSCGQCTTKYCEEGDKGLYLNLMEQNNYLLQEIKKIGEEVRKNGEEIKVIKGEVQRSRDEINKTREEIKRIGDKTDKIALSCVNSTATPSADGVCINECYLIHSNSSWKHCGDVYKAGYNQSGVYRIKPTSSPKPVDVYCDHSNGGGWTVFQRRQDGRVLFNRTWKEYADGFGDLQTEFWLGNDVLANMTASPVMTLRVDLMAFNEDSAYAEYKDFKVSSEDDNYRLKIGSYSGTAGETGGRGLYYHNNMQFSTIDRDNDKYSSVNCATSVSEGGDGGWWYKDCTCVNLNGYYKHHIPPGGTRLYIVWDAWTGKENLQRTTMRLRPSNF